MKRPQLKTHGTVKCIGGNEIALTTYSPKAREVKKGILEFGNTLATDDPYTSILIVHDGYDTQEVFAYIQSLMDDLNKTLNATD